MKIPSNRLIRLLNEMEQNLDDIEFLILNLNNENYNEIFKDLFQHLKEIECKLDILRNNEATNELFNSLQNQYHTIVLLIEKMNEKWL